MKNGALFKTAKDLALIAVMTALLIAVQLALSMVAGVELVTVLFLSYCYCFGVRRGMVVATCFSLLRCLLQGFAPNVIVLYLIYFNVFAVVSGILGHCTRNMKDWKRLVIAVSCAVVMTVCFSLLDDVITPYFLRYGPNATKVYFYNSLITMGIQSVCALCTVSILFLPLTRVLDQVAKMHSPK